MFGIDFPELVVIAVVALIVIGPEHLPKVARTVGHLWGRAQRYVSSVKADMSRDMALDELRKLQQTAQQEVSNIKLAMSEASQEVAQQLSDIESEVTASKYDLGQSIPPNEVSTKVLDKNELLKSEMPRGNAAESSLSAGNMPQSNIPRHEIIEEHHAVLPISAEHKKTTSS
jgi:sec-independent protein translocase protein TatB